jgi:hypothetical protein
MQTYEYVDTVSQFYIEFLRYAVWISLSRLSF